MLRCIAIAAFVLGSHAARGQGAELPPLIDRAPKMSDGVFGVGAGLVVGSAGLSAGDRTGFNLALRNEALQTVSSTVGWDLSDGYFHANGDYQVPFAEFTSPDSVSALTLYTGIGATIDIADEFGLGARVPVVAAISFDKPLEVFMGLTPVVGVLPEVGIRLEVTAGIRGWFKPKQSDGDGLEVGGE